MTYQQMEAQLFARARHGMKLGLERMERALAQLGHPERCAPVFHVAGTNGKGSTCAFLAASLRAAGLRTALYTSPHLEHFGERFQIDGTPATEAELLAGYLELERRLPWAFEGPEALTFFELVTLLGFQHFAQARVDVMVIEVGLGGRLDATNAVHPLVTCITPIGFDHKEFLGETIAQIALEKAGILKPGIPGVIARQPAEAEGSIERHARDVGAPLSVEGDDFTIAAEDGALAYRSRDWHVAGIALGLRGEHQRSNAAVAVRALELARLRGLPIEAEHVRAGLKDATWPGRLEVLRTRPEVVLDGAHNPPAAEVLARAMRALYAGRSIHLVLGMLGDKEAQPVVDALAPLARQVTVTTPPSPRALPAAQLAARIRGNPRVIEDPAQAVDQAIAHAAEDEVVLVAGSLYLVGCVRAHLRGGRASGPGEMLHPAPVDDRKR